MEDTYGGLADPSLRERFAQLRARLQRGSPAKDRLGQSVAGYLLSDGKRVMLDRDDGASPPDRSVRVDEAALEELFRIVGAEAGKRVFVSYCQRDHEPVREVVQFLEGNGFSVWWDIHLVPGENIGAAVGRELEAADAVVVLWSENSIRSDWVLDEAQHALAWKKMVPVLLRGFEASQIPMPFRRIQAASIDEKEKLLLAVDAISSSPRG